MSARGHGSAAFFVYACASMSRRTPHVHREKEALVAAAAAWRRAQLVAQPRSRHVLDACGRRTAASLCPCAETLRYFSAVFLDRALFVASFFTQLRRRLTVPLAASSLRLRQLAMPVCPCLPVSLFLLRYLYARPPPLRFPAACCG